MAVEIKPDTTQVISPPVPKRADRQAYNLFIRSYITDMAVARFSPEQIESRLREERHFVSLIRIRRILEALKKQWQSRTNDNIESIVTREVLALDALQSKLWPTALNGDLLTVDRILKLMDHRAKLLGLYAPTQRQITGQVTLVKTYVDIDVERV